MDEVLSRLSKSTRDKVRKASEIEIEMLPTASPGLNSELSGGFPIGRIVLVWGQKSAGKSAFCLQTLANAQSRGMVSMWVDAEDSYDPKWAERMGVDNDRVIVSGSKSISEMANEVINAIEAGVQFIVVDSISALLPSSFYQKDSDELKEHENTKQIGTFSKDLGSALKMINAINRGRACVVFISQTRNGIETYGAVAKPDGGYAMKFYASTVVKLWANASDAKQIKNKVAQGNQKIDQNVGREVTWTIEYAKTSAPLANGSYDFYYRGDNVGIDQVAETISLGVKTGVIEKSGGWYAYADMKKYKADWKAILEDDKELYEMLLKEIDDAIR